MDINPTAKVAAGAGLVLKGPVRNVQSPREDANFGRVDALNRRLASTPDSRAARVEAAKQQVSLADYPPPEALDRIARLLAMNLVQETESPGAGSP